MLWRKESKSRNALYVDLFTFDFTQAVMNDYINKMFECKNTTLDKSDETALRKRKEGNTYFGRHQWSEAMELYNESLCYAKPGSEHISLAYSNRSACFFNMKMYTKCMIDIEHAMKAGFPEQMMPKLIRRNDECLKLIQDGTEVAGLDFSLSFEPHDKFSVMANVLKLETNAGNSISMVANEDIAVGKTVMVDKAFITWQHKRFGWECCICHVKCANLIPCKRCTVAMFCADCRSNTLHKDECGLKVSNLGSINGIVMGEVRTILKVASLFSSVDELMDFVERVVKSGPNEMPETLSDERSRYKAFLKLPVCEDYDFDHYSFLVHPAYKTVLKIPKLKAMFSSLKHRRFLAHLIYKHAEISENNAMKTRISPNERMAEPDMEDYINGYITLMSPFIKHSCAPNVTAIDSDDKIIYKTLRPIKKGEQLQQSLFVAFLLEPNETRKKIMFEARKLDCKCTRCQGITATREERQRLAADPDYRFIASKNLTLKYHDSEAVQAMNAKCEAFLTRFSDVKWCDEIAIVVDAYVNLLMRKHTYGHCSASFTFFKRNE